jgi:hypothetical protein
MGSDAKLKSKEDIQGLSELQEQDQQTILSLIQGTPASAMSSKSTTSNNEESVKNDEEAKSPQTKRAKLEKSPEELKPELATVPQPTAENVQNPITVPTFILITSNCLSGTAYDFFHRRTGQTGNDLRNRPAYIH